MDQHARCIALRPSQLAMRDGGAGVDGVTVLTGQCGCAQPSHYVVKQLRKMSGALLIAKMKMVEFRGGLCSSQPICDQTHLTAPENFSHALLARRLRFVILRKSSVRDWHFEGNSHLILLSW